MAASTFDLWTSGVTTLEGQKGHTNVEADRVWHHINSHDRPGSRNGRVRFCDGPRTLTLAELAAGKVIGVVPLPQNSRLVAVGVKVQSPTALVLSLVKKSGAIATAPSQLKKVQYTDAGVPTVAATTLAAINGPVAGNTHADHLFYWADGEYTFGAPDVLQLVVATAPAAAETAVPDVSLYYIIEQVMPAGVL